MEEYKFAQCSINTWDTSTPWVGKSWPFTNFCFSTRVRLTSSIIILVNLPSMVYCTEVKSLRLNNNLYMLRLIYFGKPENTDDHVAKYYMTGPMNTENILPTSSLPVTTYRKITSQWTITLLHVSSSLGFRQQFCHRWNHVPRQKKI